MKFVVAVSMLLSLCSPLAAQTLAASTTTPATFPDYTITAGKRDKMNLPTTGATLCILPEKKICYAMPAEPALAGSSTSGHGPQDLWQFGLNPHSERYGNWILFTAGYYGGAETYTRLTLLSYNNGTITNLLPYLGVTELGEYAMWNEPTLSPYPILVIADAPHDITVTLASIDPQPFTITVWKFDASASAYKLAFTYQTTRQYRGGSKVSTVGVLKPERDEILRRLMAK